MSIKNLDDQALIKSYILGNEKAFEVLLMRHKNKMYRFILLKVKDADLAEDLFQDTFIKIINTFKLGNYNEEGKFLPWAMRIAHNLVIDYFRKANRVKFVRENPSVKEDFNIFNILPSDEDTILQKMSKEEVLGQMVELLVHLPKVQQEMIQMRIFNDMSFKEIAEAEAISINTALGRMRYALMNLRKLIEKHNLVVDVF
ncbi:MAG: sigma-70 family RNA polymerase sigma factor [Bacteroidota bacterium]